MPFIRQNLSGLIATAIQDIKNGLVSGVAPAMFSVLNTLATSTAGFAYSMYGFLDAASLQTTIFTCTGAYLEAWGGPVSISRKLASAATGAEVWAGSTVGAVIPAGTLLNGPLTTQYRVQADYTLGSNTLMAFQALVAGSAANQAAGVVLSLNSPIVGLSSSITTVNAITGGSDPEDDDSLRARTILAFSNRAQGGSAADYVGWALAVPGVTRAWTRAGGAGLGSVVIYFMEDFSEVANNGFPQGTNGVAASETRYGTQVAIGDQLTVANSIYDDQPVTALVYVTAPLQQAININIANLSPSTSAIKLTVAAALADLLTSRGTPLGGTIYSSAITSAIQNALPATGQFDLVSPVGHVTTALGYLPVVGTLTWS